MDPSDVSVELAIEYMATRGISEATVLEHDVHHATFRNAIAFPYFDAFGVQRGMRYRNLDPDAEAKYISERGSTTRLYNVAALGSHDEPVFICEGEIDTLTLVQRGRAAVGVPGCRNFKESWKWLFVDRVVYVCFDGDVDGVAWGAKIISMLNPFALEVSFLRPPPDQDVNSMHMAETLGAWLP